MIVNELWLTMFQVPGEVPSYGISPAIGILIAIPAGMIARLAGRSGALWGTLVCAIWFAGAQVYQLFLVVDHPDLSRALVGALSFAFEGAVEGALPGLLCGLLGGWIGGKLLPHTVRSDQGANLADLAAGAASAPGASDKAEQADEERRKAEKSVREREERQERERIMKLRRLTGKCIMCGKPLLWIVRFLGTENHRACVHFSSN